MINVLITGKTSFIGGAVAARLNEFPDRYRVKTISLREDGWRTEGFKGWDCVLHAAGIAHVSPDPSLAVEYQRVNRDLTLEVARQAKADGVQQFIFLSSMIVYGDAPPAGVRRRIGPDTLPAPSNAYGQSKLDAEKGLQSLADAHFQVAVLRPPMVYGRGCKGNYNLLSRLARQMPFFPKFENERSILYVGNLAECVRLIVEDGGGGLYFPQEARTFSVCELVDAIARVHGRRMRFWKCLNPVVRLLGRRGLARRAFGDMAYDLQMSQRPAGYRRLDFETSIRETEGAAES